MTRVWTLRRLLLTVAGVLALGAVACNDGGDDDTPPEVPQIVIDALDFSYDAPASIEGGLTGISMTNSGAEDHLALLFRLDEGSTFEDFQELGAAAESEADLEAIGTFVGGPGSGPGGEGQVVLDLDPGQYVLLCPVPSPDGIPHFAKGMIQPLEVTASPATQPASPESDLTVTLSDFAYDVPDTLPAGTTTIETVNSGPQIHEMAIGRLGEGVTPEQALEALSAPPGSAPPSESPEPFTFIGGVFPMSAGESGLTTIDLTEGTYIMLCFVTDPSTSAPHVALGMFDSFAVE